MELILAAVLLLILGAEFVNGWTDAPNAIATAISTKVLTPKTAVIMAAIFNALGTFSGTAVATTIGKGIVKSEMINLTTIAAAMVGIIFWSILAWRWGLPTSESHALIAGLTGAGLATGGFDVLLFSGWKKVIFGLGLSSFLGFFVGFALIVLIFWVFQKARPAKMRQLFSKLQIASSMFMAFSHGSNDGQKFIGTFSLALLLGGVISNFYVPFWVILACAAVMAAGTYIGGWRIIKTMGMKMAKLEPYHGFAAETGAALLIETASHFGIPLSTTHTISTSIMGVGSVKRFSAVKWGIVGNVIMAWVLTFPICAAIAFILAKTIQWII